MNLLPILYALLAAITGLSLGGVDEARASRPAVSAAVQVARQVAASTIEASRIVATLRPDPVAPRIVAGQPLALIATPLNRMPARRRE
ncbi:hypothetical protein [Sphingomonas sp.]|uniref:hypothetical protein n=1 Tax=Sphingomonas sp. TaxID=28214 RepID=UPI002C2DF72C|nr:hypothetical protein [Sphingomonas sp.]HTG38301.1 hypothetical protein [Sphingomonas sp.]